MTTTSIICTILEEKNIKINIVISRELCFINKKKKFKLFKLFLCSSFFFIFSHVCIISQCADTQLHFPGTWQNQKRKTKMRVDISISVIQNYIPLYLTYFFYYVVVTECECIYNKKKLWWRNVEYLLYRNDKNKKVLPLKRPN